MRYFKVTLLFFIAVCLSACVIERLLAFKHQLKNPYRYIEFKHPGILKLKHPILKIEDIELLTGVKPTKIQNDKVLYDFIRSDLPQYSLQYRLIFSNGRLSIIDYPDVFDKVVTGDFASKTLKMVGHADFRNGTKLNIKNQEKKIQPPSEHDIYQSFGPPTHITTSYRGKVLHYHYKHPTINKLQEIKISLVFKKSIMVEIMIQLPGREWVFDLSSQIKS